jgi:hypothetical protein
MQLRALFCLYQNLCQSIFYPNQVDMQKHFIEFRLLAGVISHKRNRVLLYLSEIREIDGGDTRESFRTHTARAILLNNVSAKEVVDPVVSV